MPSGVILVLSYRSLVYHVRTHFLHSHMSSRFNTEYLFDSFTFSLLSSRFAANVFEGFFNLGICHSAFLSHFLLCSFGDLRIVYIRKGIQYRPQTLLLETLKYFDV
jgi:hypothetical protein